MIGRCRYLSRYPQAFEKLTGITNADFTEMAATLVPLAQAQRRERLT